jgi:hypothetical protein
MSDDADRAAEYQENLNANAHRAYTPTVKAPPGLCVWCRDDIASGQFCDADCRDDWEKYTRRQRNGG